MLIKVLHQEQGSSTKEVII